MPTITSTSSSQAVTTTTHTARLQLSQPLAHGETVDIGQPEVDERQLELARRGVPHGVAAGRVPADVVAVTPQAQRQYAAGDLVVLDEERPGHRAFVLTNHGPK
jgi:hypothetical protein